MPRYGVYLALDVPLMSGRSHAGQFRKFNYALLLALQGLLLAFVVLGIYYGHLNFVVRTIGLLAIFGVVLLVHNQRRSRLRRNRPPFPVKRREWLVGGALLVVLGASIAWLFHDASVGYKGGGGPLFVFLAAVLACSLWWGSISSRWFKWWF